MVQRALGHPLKPGELGVVLARAGVGKTACLTHIALEELLRGEAVLHVCIGEIPDKIKVWYQEFLKNLNETLPGEDCASLQHRIEPSRFILAYLHQTFSPEKLEKSLGTLRDQAKFFPAMVVLDGLDFDRISRPMIQMLQDFARKQEVSLWMSARTHRHISEANERGIPYPCHALDDLFNAIVLLEPTPDAIRVKVLKHNEQYQPEHPPVFLNGQTYLLMTE
jgi:hypothetical protein